jgi:FixJ family two-component response regulator
VALLGVLAKRGSTVPVVLMTGRDDAATRDLLRRRGATPCLRKPFSDCELFDAIEEASSR